MKTLIALLLTAISVLADGVPPPVKEYTPPQTPPPATKTAQWIDSITATPFAAWRTIDYGDGGTDWGAGVDIGLRLNKSVSLHLDSVGYGEPDWGGSAIDESSALVRADLIKAYENRFCLYAIGGGTRNWQQEDWAFGGGLGVDLKLSDKLSLTADTRIRAYFKENPKDLLTRMGLCLHF